MADLARILKGWRRHALVWLAGRDAFIIADRIVITGGVKVQQAAVFISGLAPFPGGVTMKNVTFDIGRSHGDG